MPLLPAYGR
jgi:hypothetical protein